MKKLVFMFVAVAAISFASCGNKTQQAENPDSLEVVAPDSANDSTQQNDSLQNDSLKNDSLK